MDLADANVLVPAHRDDAPNHSIYRPWLEEFITRDQAFGMADLVLSGFVRIVTHLRVFNPPSDFTAALSFDH